jgi:phage shock protein C
MRNRLYRSRSDRVISGVAGGVADALDIDPSIVRVVWVILAFMTGGIALLVYLVMLIVVPEEPGDDFDWGVVPPGPPSTRDAGSGAPEADTDELGRPILREETGAAFTPPPAAAWPPESRSAERRESRRARRAARESQGPGGGALVFGLILILVGGYFLLRQYIPALDMDLIWPIVVIGLGVLLLLASLRSRDRGSS